MAAPATAPEFRFEHAEFAVSDADAPPESGWQLQSLPDSWRHNHPGLAGIAWYRMRFVLDAVPTEVMALYVGRIADAGQFWLNGLVLNPEVRFTGPKDLTPDVMARWPQLITLPGGLLRAGENVLRIRMQASPVGGRGLWDVRIGPLEQLRTTALVREIPQRTLPQALFVLTVAGSVLGLLVCWRDPRARNLHFTGVTVLWTAIVGMWILPRFPITAITASILLTALYVVFYWALLSLFYRYSGSRWRWYPRLLNVVSALTLVGALVLVAFDSDRQNSPWHVGLALSSTILLRLLATVMLLQAAWRKRSPRAYALAATEVLWFAGHMQIVAIIAGWLPPGPVRLDPASSLPLYLVLAYFFVDRLIRDRDQAIREQQAAIGAERARILQDMHDGMGSQLITALRLAQRDDGDRTLVARSIEEALQDLRLIIDSLDVSDQRLVPMLGNLRYRLEPRLSALGIRLEWQADGPLEPGSLTPHAALGVLRIVQEALNNAVKHARPSTITVSVTGQGNATVIGVSDDGIGFNPEVNPGAGRGLANMQRRADAIGARLQVTRRDGGGTAVVLHVPTEPAAMPQAYAATAGAS